MSLIFSSSVHATFDRETNRPTHSQIASTKCWFAPWNISNNNAKADKKGYLEITKFIQSLGVMDNGKGVLVHIISFISGQFYPMPYPVITMRPLPIEEKT